MILIFAPLQVILRLLVAALLLSSCGRSEQSHLLEAQSTQARQAYWQEMAPLCAGYPAKADCVDGDMTLFAGLLCVAGEERGCAMVRDSQGADGRWWRSPRRNPGNLGETHSFSRDMALGVLLYLVSSRDTGAAERWLAWIKGNRSCMVDKPGGGCLVRGPYRFCRDDSDLSCTLTPGNWALLGRVWAALGLELSAEMRWASGLDSDALWLQAKVNPLGFELHLQAVEVLLKQRLTVDQTSTVKAASILVERQPQNPFFSYLQGGGSAALQQQLLALCPDPAQGYARRNQWAWERATDGQAWRDSMGWDCLFLSKLAGS